MMLCTENTKPWLLQTEGQVPQTLIHTEALFSLPGFGSEPLGQVLSIHRYSQELTEAWQTKEYFVMLFADDKLVPQKKISNL